MNSEFENQLVKVFLEEAFESLVLWETTCLNIDKADKEESLNNLFRIAHNLKGSSFSVGLQQLGNYIHKVEELMTSLRKGEILFSSDILNLFFEVHSLLVSWVESLHKDYAFIQNNTEQSLNKILNFQKKSPEIAENTKKASDSDSDDIMIFEDDEKKEETKDNSAAPTNLGNNLSSPVLTTGSKLTPIEPTIKPRVDADNLKENNSKTSTPAPKSTFTEEYLKVNVHKLDTLINFIGEIVVDQNIMKQKSETQLLPLDIKNVVHQMGKNIQELQNIAMSLRMMPLEQQFQKMHRIVRDLSMRQEKDINFISFGEDVELDKLIVEKLTDPLTHLIRNAIDHGIEDKAERIKKNKPSKCNIELRAMQVENNVRIYLKDDGKGIDENIVLRKAIEKGIVDKNSHLKKEEIHRLIFKPGFSTKDEISDISGRGVGLDVVNKVISELKGFIEIETEINKGTTFTITLPSSLSIIKGIIIKINNQLFVLPESNLTEIVDHKKFSIEKRINGTEVFTLRKDIIPIIPLQEILGLKQIEEEIKKERNGIVIQHLGEKISFEVDEVVATQSIVLKPLSKELMGLPGVVATTVLGSGEPALVLNLSNLVNIWGNHGAR